MNQWHDGRKLRAGIAAALAACGLTAGELHAADWYWAPGAAIGADYNDNPGLSSRSDEEDSIFGAIGQASLEFGYLAPTSSGWVRPRLRFRRYGSDDEARDSDDQFVDFRFDGDRQTSRWGVYGNWGHEQVRTAELADVNLDPDEPDIPDDDSGIIDLQGRRDRLRIHPFYDWDVTPVSTIGVDAVYVDTSYDDEVSNLRDYSDLRGEIQYRRRMTPITQWVTGVFGRDYSSDDGDVTGYGVRTGIDREISETMQLEFLVGAESADPDVGDTETDMIADVFLTRRLQTTWLQAGYRRSLAGSGIGTVSLRDEIYLAFRRDLTELVSAGLGLRAYRANAINEENADRDYAQMRAEFTWRLTESFSIVGDYRFTFLDREEEAESADSNQAYLYLQWAPPRPGR